LKELAVCEDLWTQAEEIRSKLQRGFTAGRKRRL